MAHLPSNRNQPQVQERKEEVSVREGFVPSKRLKMNFRELIVTAQCNEVVVLDHVTLQTVDHIKGGHVYPIDAIDVSAVQRIIVTLSSIDNSVAFYGLAEGNLNDFVCQPFRDKEQDQYADVEYSNVVQNQNIYAGRMKWNLLYKTKEASIFKLRSLAISPLGDFVVLGGNQSMSVYTQDASNESYTRQILYTKDRMEGQMGQIVEEEESLTGNIFQTDICGEGRLIATLEAGSKSVKIWSKSTVVAQEYVMATVGSKIRNNYRHQVETKVEEKPKRKKRHINFESLSVYELPEHAGEVKGVKFIKRDLQELDARPIPASLLTIVNARGAKSVSIWVENMLDPALSFNCVQTITAQCNSPSHSLNKTVFDADFVYLPAGQAKDENYYPVMPWHSSKLFDTQRDKVSALKKRRPKDDPLGMYFPNVPDVSVDWLSILTDGFIELHRCTGLKNFPLVEGQTVTLVKIIQLAPSDPSVDLQCLRAFQFASAPVCFKFDDRPTFMCTNNYGQLIRFSTLVPPTKSAQSGQNSSPLMRQTIAEALLASLKAPSRLDATRVFPLPVANHLKIASVKTHPQLQIISLLLEENNKQAIQIMATNDIQGQQSRLHLDEEVSFKLIGEYLVPFGDRVKQMYWTNDISQLVLLYDSGRISLVQSSVFALTHIVNLDLPGNSVAPYSSWKQLCEMEIKQLKDLKIGQDNEISQLVLIDSKVEQWTEPQIELEPKQAYQTIFIAACMKQGQRLIYKTEIHMKGSKPTVNQTFMEQISTPAFALEPNTSIVNVPAQKKLDNRSVALIITKKMPPQIVLRPGQKAVGQAVKPPVVKAILCQFTGDRAPESLFEVEGQAQDLLENEYTAKFSDKYFGILLTQGGHRREKKYLYIYNMMVKKYTGFLDLNRLLGVAMNKDSSCDFAFMEDTIQGSVAIYAQDRVFLVSQTQKRWSVGLKAIDTATGLNDSFIRSSSLFCLPRVGASGSTCLMLYINGNMILPIAEKALLNKEVKDEDSEEDFLEPLEESKEEQKPIVTEVARVKANNLHSLFVQQQRSLPLFDSDLLIDLFIKGYSPLVAKLLVKLKQSLDKFDQDTNQTKQNNNSPADGAEAKVQQAKLLPDFIDMDLASLLKEIEHQVELFNLSSGPKTAHDRAEKETKAAPAKKVVQKKGGAGGAFGFSDSDDSDEDDSSEGDDAFAAPKKKVVEEVMPEPLAIEPTAIGEQPTDWKQLLKECYPELIKLIQKFGAQKLGFVDHQNMVNYMDFIVRFKNTIELDFYADLSCSILLRQVFIETEKISEEDQNILKKAAVMEDQEEEKEYIKKMDIADILKERSNWQSVSTGDLALLKDWSSANVVLAMHSANQDVIADELATRFNFEKNLNWQLMRRMCIPLWMKNIIKLKEFIQLVANLEYSLEAGNFGGSKADAAALWYVLLGKVGLLCNLYKGELGGVNNNYYKFFRNDFEIEKNRRTAIKNGGALISKKRFHLAAAFLIMGKDIQGAVQCIDSRCQDPVLAVLICKMMDPDNKLKAINSVVTSRFIWKGEQFNDPYLSNIGFWLRGDYIKAVNTLAPTEDKKYVNIMKHTITEFDLAKAIVLEEVKVEKKVEEVKKAVVSNTQSELLKAMTVGNQYSTNTISQGITKVKTAKEDKVEIGFDTTQVAEVEYPSISTGSYLSLTLLKRLEKTPQVLEIIDPTWGKEAAAGEDSIFADFMAPEQLKKSTEKEKEKETISVLEENLLAEAIYECLKLGQTLLALILIQENHEVIAKLSLDLKQMLAKIILMDMLAGIQASEDIFESQRSIKDGVTLLSNLLSINRELCDEFIGQQLGLMKMFKLEVEFLGEQCLSQKSKNEGIKRAGKIIVRIENEVKLNCNGLMSTFSHHGGLVDGVQEAIASDKVRQSLQYIISQLETILECLMIQHCAVVELEGKDEDPEEVKQQPEDVAEEPVQTPSPIEIKASPDPVKKATTGQGAFAFSEDSSDEEDSEEDDWMAAPKKKEETKAEPTKAVEEVKPQKSTNLAPIKAKTMSNKDLTMQQIALKMRAQLTMLATLLYLSAYMKKFSLFKEVLVQTRTQLRVVITYQTQILNGTISPEELQNRLFDFQTLKVFIRKIRHKLDKMTANRSLMIKNQKACQKEEQQDFFAIWTSYIIMNAARRLFKDSCTDSLKSLCIQKSNTPNIIDLELIQELEDKLSPAEVQQKLIRHHQSLTILSSTRRQSTVNRFSLDALVDNFGDMRDFLEEVSTHFFEHRMTPDKRVSYLHDVRCLSGKIDGQVNLASFFAQGDASATFRRQDKFQSFANFVNLQIFEEQLKKLQLSLIRDERELFCNFKKEFDHAKVSLIEAKTIKGVEQVFGGGVELFKQKGEQITDFCFDPLSRDMVALALQNKGVREFSALHTILYRNRTNTGLEFIDDELNSWSDCLHRYDKIAAVHAQLRPKADALIATMGSKYAHTTIFNTLNQFRKRSITMLDLEMRPAQSNMWAGIPYKQQFLNPMGNAKSMMNITHEEYAYSVESHPILPLYVSGNHRGVLCLWNFNQMNDRSLAQWVCDPPLNQLKDANPKKATIRKIQFSAYGDKLAALNMEGSLFVTNFEMGGSANGIYTPQYNTCDFTKQKDHRHNDFVFADKDSVIAAVSLKDKSFSVYDTLLPPRMSQIFCVKANNVAGNLLVLNSRCPHKAYTFNSKPGYYSELDLRMMGAPDTEVKKVAECVVKTMQLSKEDITAVCLDENNTQLIVGQADGIVKTFDLENDLTEAANPIQAFTNIQGKKGPVSRLKIHPSNGALFACSSIGCMKMLRLSN